MLKETYKKQYGNFGLLSKKPILLNNFQNSEKKEIDFLFKNSQKQLDSLNVFESDRQIALENLRKLIAQLQTKRLRLNIKSKSNYFTL